MRKILTCLFTLICIAAVHAQQTNPVEGLQDKREVYTIFTHALIINPDGTRLKDASLLIFKDRIVSVGTNVTAPQGAVIVDLKGKIVYPSFIDAYTDYGLTTKRNVPDFTQGPRSESSVKTAAYWNEAIHPEVNASQQITVDNNKASDYRKAGFGTVLSLSKDGIARGTATAITVGDGKVQEQIIRDHAAACFSFDKGSSKQDYPSSLMGSIALLRQYYYDASWYAASKNKEWNIAMEAQLLNQNLPQIFEINDYQNTYRAHAIAKEFNINYIIKTSGDEYKRIDDLKATGCKLIVPIVFPDPIDFTDPFDLINTDLATLKHWENAPGNAAELERRGITFALTSDGNNGLRDFHKNLLTAIQHGLTPLKALQCLTSIPAEILGISDQTGKIEAGKLANIIICNKELGSRNFKVLENWVRGKQYMIINQSDEIRGNYKVSLDTLSSVELRITGEPGSLNFQFMRDSTSLKTIAENPGQDIYTFRIASGKNPVLWRMQSTYNNLPQPNFSGDAQLPDGRWVKWSALKYKDYIQPPDTGSVIPDTTKGPLLYPFTAYGFSTLPVAGHVLIKNITVWTNEDAGIIKSTDVLIADGKIVKIGKITDLSGIKINDLEIIDGTGKHLTSGIIDEHSHIAISGDVNEGTQAITAEVRIGDVINCEDINIYRQLAGGVTTSQLLHGSANPVGGQSAIVKLRWGESGNNMKMTEASPFIKFALGENVKQSNWGDLFNKRYPQTRMGVEQIYIDAFCRARAYAKAQDGYRQSAKNKISDMPRRDLELDALSEILSGKRFITCHSYQQGEINMLMHVADTFGFHVNTFTHILEGYKVADKMKRHGVGASSFADWWSYKYEVIEAIPYNGAILHDEGVITAFNSDDAEMARRLNQEAAKAVKYGNVSEEEALKFVTLNPAKLLHIDQYVGSIKEGKQADVVIWNGNPLSVYSHPLKTFVDGKCYFDIERDAESRKYIEKEKIRIAAKMLQAKDAGATTVKPSVHFQELNDCEANEQNFAKP